MTESPHTGRRARWLAGQTGVHVPYLDVLPASETVRYANAAIAMLVSVLSAGAGWALVGSWSAAGLPPAPRSVLSVGAGLAAGLVVWSLDRDLISGDGHLMIRGTVGAVNALFVGEIVLLALFAPFVETQLNRDLDATLDQAVAAADANYTEAIAGIEADETAARPPIPDSLVADRQRVDDALGALHDAEQRLDELNTLRTAEVTGRVVVDADGQPLTSGRAGDTGLATESVDRQITDAQAVVDRAVTQLDADRANVAEGEATYTGDLDAARAQTSRLNDDRVAAQGVRDQAIAAAEAARMAPVGLLDRLRVFHHAAWGDAVLRWIVGAVHLAVFAAELSVVLWTLSDRRRPIRLYRDLVHHLDQATTAALADIAHALVADVTRRATLDTSYPDPVVAATGPTTPTLEPTQSKPDRTPQPTGPPQAAPATVGHGSTVPSAAPPDRVGPPPVAVTPTTLDAQQRLAAILDPRPVEISVLRATPTVEGVTGKLRPKHTAILAYLAIHPSAPLATLRRVFWPTSSSNSASANTLSTIRKILGHGPDAQPRLAPGPSPTLSTDVGSDWGRFVDLTSDLPHHSAADRDRLAYLTAALDLVNGPPGVEAHGSPANWDWLVDPSSSSGTGQRITAAVHAATGQLIQLARRTAHHELIDWSTAKARLLGDYQPPPTSLVDDPGEPPVGNRPLVSAGSRGED